MLALGLQTLLLMSAAYCLGAALACVVRRRFFSSVVRAPIQAERRVEPLPQADLDVVGTRRFVPAAPEAPARPQPPPAASAVALPADAADQELQRIYAIDAATETSLKALGIRRYEQIGRWRRPDLDHIAQALGIRRQRINRENWIEQAQVLAAGGQTHYAGRWGRGEVASAAPTAATAPPARRPPPAAVANLAPAATVAGPSGPVVATRVMPAVVLAPARVSERAAFARPRPAAPHVPSRVAEPAGPPRRPPAPATAAVVAEAAASDGRPIEPAKPVRPPPAAVDNLQRIRGVNAQLAQRLSAAGVWRYGQIASWSATDVERFERQLEAGGRIARENWIEQAQILSRGGDTVFSRAFDRGAPADSPPASAPAATADEAIPPDWAEPPARPVSLGALRSVRSQAYQNPEPGPEAAYRVGSHNRVVRSAPPQDLKRIRGIGVLIERRLNAMQITSYEQIANWTAADIERVSRTLDFKGRIERENWVEQARILASGGATEFSRRVDRGDVETGRYRP
jgi:predicted flap endonuclease-1-like 5' DNA nuclease